MSRHQPKDSLSKWTVRSAVLHLVVGLGLTTQAFLFPSEDLIIQSAMKVDLVGMPDKLPPKKIAAQTPEPKAVKKEPKPPTPPKPKPKPKKPKAPKVVLKKDKKKPRNSKKDQKKALQKLKALEALDKIKEEVKQESTAKTPAQPIKGNAVNEGSGLKGLEKLEFNKYFGQVEVHIKEYWKLPQWLADSNLKAHALVQINPQGLVVGKKITLSSGNETFDQNVLQALQEASPLPAPPDRLAGVLESRGVIFKFPD